MHRGARPASAGAVRGVITTEAPDERALRAHLRSGRFQAGVDTKWRLIEPVKWPLAMIAVAAAARSGAPDEFVIRFELQGYPGVAPTGGLWDLASDSYLDLARRPKGGEASSVFRCDGWLGGGKAMYAAWDRLGLQAHPDWAQRYPRSAWHQGRDLTFILENVYRILHSDDYLGI